ncbi:hypothetical protein Forpe1208_v003449 [Fusarium oxysporum f. sp. rapae]|uniref:Glycosyl hydrolase family 43 protein n=1 Tax=Fusarium oxysporum f. sp. rapae TaxID=485398 RepID=A0A8J5PH13_FUSOX|nr:hypothetical protein Forpe1208_v003449 [Fusarium oxysporum f. sp. rapae]
MVSSVQERRYDTEGRSLQAHGGGLLEVDGTCYLIGENKTRTASNPRGNLYNSVAFGLWDARSGVAVSDTPCGDYEYLGSLRPEGHIARDMTLFVDDDSSAYLVGEDRKEGTHFFQLSNNYTVVDSLVATIPYSLMSALEAPAVVKTNGAYYFFGSHLTGWSTNDNQYTTAKDLKGSWSKPATFAPTGSKTCNSQTTLVLQTAAGKYV